MIAGYQITAEAIRNELKKTLLSGSFRHQLDLVYEFHNDELDVRHLTEVYRSIKWNVPTFPSAEISLGKSRNADPTSDLVHLSHDVLLFFHERDDDEEMLEDRVGRMLHAARNFFREYNYLEMIGVGPIQLGDDDYSPFVPDAVYKGRPFIKTGLLTLTMESFG